MANSENFHKISIEEIETAIDENKDFSFNVKNSMELEIKKEENILCRNPNIYTIDNFISNEECEHFIKLSKPNLKQALVSNDKKGYVSDGRTGKNFWIPHNTDIIIKSVGEKIAKKIGVALNTAEQYQVIYYDKTEEYKQHYDSWAHDGSEKSRRCMKYGGQRMYTALCYLNDVEEGGHTRFTKLNINVEAKKGRLLVFQNVEDGTNKKHFLSEHAGTPVIKGEKWAFNLWFREKPRTMIVYDPPVEENKIKPEIKRNLYTSKINKFHINDESKSIYKNFILDSEIEMLYKHCKFNENDGVKRLNCWGANNLPDMLKFVIKISKLIEIDISHFENINFIKYAKKFIHSSHLDAYDFKTEQGKRCMKTRGLSGQRILTITGCLTDNIEYNFLEFNKDIKLEKGTLFIYNNVYHNTDERNEKLKKSIINNSEDEEVVLFHIYVRNENMRGEQILGNSIKPPVNNRCQKKEPEQVFNEKTLNDFKETLVKSYDELLYKNNRSGYNSLRFLNKVGWNYVLPTLKKLYELRKESDGLLNKELLEQEYNFDEYNPVILNNVIKIEGLNIIQDFIKDAIKRKDIDLGDRQSNRYRARNETVTRFLHYEVLELIRKITRKDVRPTYTYLSCYTKNSDLPAHTDQPDCEYTVSFIIEKPENSSWPIYLDKKKQPTKFKGRSEYTPNKENCIACDCEPGGLMIFNGTDHIHYREPLEYDYYNVVLLHYRIN